MNMSLNLVFVVKQLFQAWWLRSQQHWQLQALLYVLVWWVVEIDSTDGWMCLLIFENCATLLCDTSTFVDQAEIDGGRGMAVMLFHVEGNVDCLVVVQQILLQTWYYHYLFLCLISFAVLNL